MMKKLLIVEAPSKAKSIQGYLGSEYIVKASVGHIREMPLPKDMKKEEKEKYGDYSIDRANDFHPLFKVSKDKSKIVTELKKLAKDASEVILATDDDAEGAAISWHLLQVLNPKVPVFRATWNEITESAVKEGLKNKKLIDQKKQEPKDFFGAAESAITRAEWDRLYGYGSSPLMWKFIRSGASSGRVQTPGARLVVERTEKRLAFKSVNFYSIKGDFEGTEGKLIEFNKQKIADGSKIDDEGNVKKGHLLITDENLDSIISELKTKHYNITSVDSKPYTRRPPAPFTTSSALQSIGGKTRMSAKMITRYFQDLYASDHAVTYIRTVSVVASPEAIQAARKQLKKDFGNHFVPSKSRVYTDKKNGNSGHECIRPVLNEKSGDLVSKKFSDPKKQKVFDLIKMRFLASQSIDCTGLTWTANIDSSDGKAKFSASETEIHEPGWTKIYQIDDEVGA